MRCTMRDMMRPLQAVLIPVALLSPSEVIPAMTSLKVAESMSSSEVPRRHHLA